MRPSSCTCKADDLKLDTAKSTFRLVKVNQQTMYFSDRPKRMVGHIKMADYLKEWAGKDNFGADLPNATLSAYEPQKTGKYHCGGQAH
jgi:hypothetical protein